MGEETGLPLASKGRRESPASEYMREYSENGGHRRVCVCDLEG